MYLAKSSVGLGVATTREPHSSAGPGVQHFAAGQAREIRADSKSPAADASPTPFGCHVLVIAMAPVIDHLQKRLRRPIESMETPKPTVAPQTKGTDQHQ